MQEHDLKDLAVDASHHCSVHNSVPDPGDYGVVNLDRAVNDPEVVIKHGLFMTMF